MLLDIALRPAWHGGSGPWDEIISWGTVLVVVALIGAFAIQSRREQDDEDGDDEDMPP